MFSTQNIDPFPDGCKPCRPGFCNSGKIMGFPYILPEKNTDWQEPVSV